MKTARVEIDAITLLCPECGGCLIEPNSGALSFTKAAPLPDKAVCVDCGETVKVPKRARKILNGR